MRKFLFLVPVAALVLAADVSAQTTVTYQVAAINEISFSTSAISLLVNTATAGSQPTPAVHNTSTWAITTNDSTRKVTGQLSAAMPTGVTLSVTLAAPSVGTSAGEVALGAAAAANLVTGITQVVGSGLAVTYKLAATVSAGVVPSGTRIVTYTVTSGV